MKAKSSAIARQRRVLRNRLRGTQSLEQRKLLAGDLFSGFFSVVDFAGSETAAVAEESFFRGADMTPNVASLDEAGFLEFIAMDSGNGEPVAEGVEVVEFDADLSPEKIAELLGFDPTDVMPATMVGEWEESDGWFEVAIETGEDAANDFSFEIFDFEPSELEGVEWNIAEAGGASFEFPGETALLSDTNSVELIDFNGQLNEEDLESLFDRGAEDTGFVIEAGGWDAVGDSSDWSVFADDAIEIDFELDPSTAAQMELGSLDVDGDGSATAEEITTSYVDMYGLREEAAAGAAQAMIDAFDTNDDAAIDASELIVSYNRDLAQAELEQLDQDRDGLASMEELTQSYSEFYGLREAAAKGAAQGLLDAFDADENGGLDLEELTASYPTEIVVDPGTPIDFPEEDPTELAESVFASLDADEDGEATRAEITESFIALGLDEFMAAEAADEMLSVFDTDESGSISLSEVVDSIESGNSGIVLTDTDMMDTDLNESGDAIELDLPEDATPEQIAEALGVSVEDIEFIDADVVDEVEFDELPEGVTAVSGKVVELDLPENATPEQIAEALGVAVEDIEIVDVGETEEVELDEFPEAMTPDVGMFATRMGELSSVPAIVSNDMMIDFGDMDGSSPRAFHLQMAADELAAMMSGSDDDVIIMGDHACHFFTPESVPTENISAAAEMSGQADAFFDVNDDDEETWQYADLQALLLSLQS
ncbi:MAG: hypothetical protein AAGG44_01000 [Planctomycetota bacterium]